MYDEVTELLQLKADLYSSIKPSPKIRNSSLGSAAVGKGSDIKSYIFKVLCRIIVFFITGRDH